MTEKLYYADQYMKSFSGRVLSCTEAKGGFEIRLDRSAFYPEGGGQPGDTGTLNGLRVKDTYERDGELIHLCAGPLAPGTQAEGAIDWPRRYDFMQQHSGEHVVSGIIHSMFGYNNTGFHMGSELVTIDFSGELDYEQLMEVERRANEAVWQDSPIEVLWPSPEELKGMSYRSKKELSGPVRIVKAGPSDTCACCGTHLRRTGEAGIIKLLSVQKFREGCRIEMLSGRRAYDYLSAVNEQNRRIVALLSARPAETAGAVERLLRESEDLKYSREGFKLRLFDAVADGCETGGENVIFQPGLEPGDLRRLAVTVYERRGGLCAALTGDGGSCKYALAGENGAVQALAKEMNRALGGRGGGRDGLVQGSLSCGREAAEAFLAGRR